MLWKSQKGLGPIVLTLMALAFGAATLLAQTTDGRLAGRAVDDSEAALPGATVTISSEVLMGTRVTQADADGGFAFDALPPGMYTVRVELDGFLTVENPAVQVRLGRTTQVRLELSAGEFTEEVTVVADTPVIDPEQVSTSQTFTPEYLEKSAVSSLNRGYQSVLSAAAGVTGGTNPNVFGSTLGENAYYIDGIDSTDPVTATFGINLNFDTIQEINFETAGFEAEYGRATGGVVDVITKSGGNTFAGTVDLRYRDSDFNTSGDHFDPDADETEFTDPSVTLGGPILRDRLWFFVSGEQTRAKVTPTESPTTRDFDGVNLMGKLTWQINPQWNAFGRYLDEDATIDNANAGRLIAPEATRQQEQPAQIYSAELFGLPSRNVAVSLAAAVVRNELNSVPQSGDFATIGHFDEFGDRTRSVNFTNAQLSDRDRDELKGSVTLYVDDLLGDHELKVGAENASLFFRSENFTTGSATIDGRLFEGLRYSDAFGEPLVLWYEPNSGADDNDGDLFTGYVQDTWRLNPEVTLKLGVRYDTVAFDNDAGQEIADLDKVQPRVGLAWDLTGDGKTVARASWGRFMHPNALTLPSFARINNLPSFAYLSCEANGIPGPICEGQFGGDLTASGITVPTWIPDPTGFTPDGWVLVPGNVFSSAPNIVDPDLEATYADALVVGFERELGRRTSAGLTYVSKETEDIFEDTCNGNFPVVGGSDDCDFYVMTNLPGLRREYEGVILDFESRFTDWMHVLASYTYSESKGNVEYTQNAGVDFDVFPVHFDNRFGYLADHARHRVKVNGFVDLPLDFTVGVDAVYSSAYRFNVLEAVAPYGDEFVESRGAGEANDLYRLDLQVAKGFEVGGIRLELIGAVLNALDDEQVTAVCGRVAGCADVSLGGPLTFRQPRFYEAGFRIEW